jgi:hypothetical protein
MSDLIRKDASELAGLVSSGEVSAVEVAQAHLDRIAAVDGDVHAFLHVDTEGALASAAAVDAKVKAGDKLSVLAGVPLGLKDILATNGLPTTCGSRVLDGWIPPYDATVVTKLREAGVVILGKTNMDEFAMGSSTEHSAFGPTHNPWDLERIPGGSGGGSSACVSSFEAPLAIYEGRFGLYTTHTPAGHDLKMDAVAADLGSAWELMRVAIKPYAACHFTHACIDIAIELATENNLMAADIESVTTIVPSQVVPVVCEPAQAKLTPRSDYDAKFSLPFIVATAIAKRRFTLADLDDDCLVDPELLELAAKVSYQNDPNPTFPKYFHGEVIIQTKDGRTLRKREDINRGADERPLSVSDVETKFRDNVSLVAGTDVADRVLNAVMSLPTTKNSRDFVEALTTK